MPQIDNPRASIQAIRRPFLAAVTISLLALGAMFERGTSFFGPSTALAVERGNFNHLVPKKVDGDRYEFNGEIYLFSASGGLDKDREKDGIKETTLRRHTTPGGKRINSYTTYGKVWAWYHCPKSKCSEGDSGFVIADTNCDGVFDTKYIGNESFFLPACLKSSRR